MSPEEKQFLQAYMDAHRGFAAHARTLEDEVRNLDTFVKCAQILQLDRIANTLERLEALATEVK